MMGFKWPWSRKRYPELNKFADDNRQEIIERVRALNQAEKEAGPYVKNPLSFMGTTGISELIDRMNGVAELVDRHHEKMEPEDREAFAWTIRAIAHNLDPTWYFDPDQANASIDLIREKFRPKAKEPAK